MRGFEAMGFTTSDKVMGSVSRVSGDTVVYRVVSESGRELGCYRVPVQNSASFEEDAKCKVDEYRRELDEDVSLIKISRI